MYARLWYQGLFTLGATGYWKAKPWDRFVFASLVLPSTSVNLVLHGVWGGSDLVFILLQQALNQLNYLLTHLAFWNDLNFVAHTGLELEAENTGIGQHT